MAQIQGGCASNGAEIREDLFFAHFEEWIVHGAIVAKVDEVASAVFGGGAKVGMLEEAGERIAWVADVDPVAIGKLAIKGEDEALGPIRLAPVILLAIVCGKSGDQAAGEAGGQGGDDAVDRPSALTGLHLPASILAVAPPFLRGCRVGLCLLLR